MPVRPRITSGEPLGQVLRGALSLTSLGLATLLLLATFTLMSPPPGASYPDAIPWRPGSLLRSVTEALSLYGAVATVRGVEIKDFAFHLTTLAALVLLALRALVSALLPPQRRARKGVWFVGQCFLVGWVGVSLASSLWADDPALARGQAGSYGLTLAWALALGWNLEGRDVPRLLWAYLVVAVLGALLCLWYFYERNPYHNPGFPIGNPNSLAACIVPATLLAAAVGLGALLTALRERRLSWQRPLVAATALLPLCWCLKLTGSLAATVGLTAGAIGLLWLRARRRVRWTVLVVLLILSAMSVGAIRYIQPDLLHSFAMSRGPTIRFRLYAWRYAAVLWSQHPFGGVGAGQYPRLANGLSTWDRALDPAAFMGELVEHAHNELFEVFAEIGLLGGVTFVAGFLATLAGAAALLRADFSPQRRWLIVGLVAGMLALLADALFGVGPRLPGVPAVLGTLLGTLWAACRAAAPGQPAENAAPDRRVVLLSRYGLGAGALLAAAATGFLALRNFSGVSHEFAAEVARREGRYQAALPHLRVAEAELLDPVRKLIAAKHAVDCRFANARLAMAELARTLSAASAPAATGPSQPTTADSPALPEQAAAAGRLCRDAYQAALRLSQRAPNFGYMAAIGAQSAELLAALHEHFGQSSLARQWRLAALRAWQSQRRLRPYHRQTLLRLADYVRRYRGLTGEYLGLLRDALREGFAPPEWHEALQAGSQTLRDFPQTLAALLQAVGPYTPQTDLDTLILSGAPEMYRLCAAWQAQQGAYASAAAYAARAALLYWPMRPRFPELYSVALSEQAEYLAAADPAQLPQAATLLREALAALPQARTQSARRAAAPYQLRLARVLLELDENERAAALLRAVRDVRPREPELWELSLLLALEKGQAHAVRRVLRDAERAGLSAAELDALRALAAGKMPELFDAPADR